MFKWKCTTKSRYWEMLEILPPACMQHNGFLVGEPVNHRVCAVREIVQPTFTAFVEIGGIDGQHYECETPLTIAEFKREIVRLRAEHAVAS